MPACALWFLVDLDADIQGCGRGYVSSCMDGQPRSHRMCELGEANTRTEAVAGRPQQRCGEQWGVDVLVK